MLINIPLYAGPKNTGPNECRVLLNALESYADHIRQYGFAENDGDGPSALQELLSVTHSIATAFLDITENLDTCSEPDGEGGYGEVYRAITSPTISKARGSLGQ